VLVGGGVGGAAVGATVGVVAVGVALGVGAAVLGGAVGDGLGASVVGAAVRIWVVMLGDGDAEGLGEGDAEVPAKREKPPVNVTPISRSVRRPPATAARSRSIQRGPRRGGGMICVVSDMRSVVRNRRADVPQTLRYRQIEEGTCLPDQR
jgi:hypothetical protein